MSHFTRKLCQRSSAPIELLVGGVLFYASACSQPADENADIVFTNAAAYALDEDVPWAEAVAIKGDRIACVVDNVDVVFEKK